MKYKHTTCKQEGGDDGYQYTVRDKASGRLIMNGLTRREATEYRCRYEIRYELSLRGLNEKATREQAASNDQDR